MTRELRFAKSYNENANGVEIGDGSFESMIDTSVKERDRRLKRNGN